jgi:hypothetical protein
MHREWQWSSPRTDRRRMHYRISELSVTSPVNQVQALPQTHDSTRQHQHQHHPTPTNRPRTRPPDAYTPRRHPRSRPDRVLEFHPALPQPPLPQQPKAGLQPLRRASRVAGLDVFPPSHHNRDRDSSAYASNAIPQPRHADEAVHAQHTPHTGAVGDGVLGAVPDHGGGGCGDGSSAYVYSLWCLFVRVGWLLTGEVTGAAAAIVWASDGTAVEGWAIGGYQVQPHVYAAMLETVMVLFTLSALGGGVVVAFWRGLLGGMAVGPVCCFYASACADLLVSSARLTNCMSRRLFCRLFGACVD